MVQVFCFYQSANILFYISCLRWVMLLCDILIIINSAILFRILLSCTTERCFCPDQLNQKYSAVAMTIGVKWHQQYGGLYRWASVGVLPETQLPRQLGIGRLWPLWPLIKHVNEYPTMHYFGYPGHTRSMIAYIAIYEIPLKIALWECC